MKKILLAISMMFALTACISEDLPQPQQTDGDNIELNFSVTIPEAGSVTRGTLGGPTITSLTVVVFDDKGYFVAARSAANPTNATTATTATNGWGVTSAETNFTVELPQSSSPRILHFVANKSPEDFAFGTETAIMTELTTSLRASGDTQSNEDEDAYWQRVEVPNLLVQDATTLSNTLKKIPLVRNFAKIKIGEVPSGFTVTGFALINTPTSGTVAPYNVNEGCFEPYWKASGDNKVGKDYSDLKDANYDAFMPVNVALGSQPTSTGDGDLTYSPYKNNDNTDGALYTYESSYKNQTAVIIKGHRDPASDTYYKVELYDATNGNYDVLRNVEYTINIENVVGEGYSTAKEAADNVGGNNISNSIATQSLLNISDGTQRLYVEYTSKRVMEASTPFTLKYRFTTNGKATNVTYNNKIITTSGSESEDNGYLTITRKITSEDGTAVLLTDTGVNTSGQTTQDSDGWSILTLTPQAQMPDGNKVWSEDLIITSKCNGVTLSRTVKLYMLNPYVMSVECTHYNIANSDINHPVTVNTIIPANLPSDIFPLVFDIEAVKLSLYPDPDATDVLGHTIVMPVVSGPSIIPSSSKNSFYYQRTLTYAEYKKLVENAGGAKTVAIPSYFLTNMKDSETNVYVHNNYFGTKYAGFNTVTVNMFSSITWSGNINRYGEGQTGTLKFNTTDTSEITVTLNGVRRDSDDNMTFKLSGATSYTIDIETVDWNTTPSVTLTGTDYVEKSSTASERNTIHIDAEQLSVSNIEYASYEFMGTQRRDTSADVNVNYNGGVIGKFVVNYDTVTNNSGFDLVISSLNENDLMTTNVTLNYTTEISYGLGVVNKSGTATATIADMIEGNTIKFTSTSN